MSADGVRKAYRYTCNMIRPQIYSEKSLMESVVDFFSDVVPQAYSGTQKVEDKEKIQWVRFETCDCNDISKNPDLYRSDTKGLPLLLILGYSNGVQIWHVTSNGEAQEIMSIRQGPVRIFRLLPLPETVLDYHDAFANKRPLAVMCDSSSAGQPYCGIKFVSLKTGDEVHSINYKTLPVQTIECNKRFLVTVFLEKICVYEACQYQQLFWVTSCFPCPGPNVNPVALSTRWLAYADKRLVAMHQSCGGMSGDGSQSYAATVISAAKGAFKGLSMFGEAMVSSVTGCKSPGMKKQEFVQLDNSNRPGIVTVVDIQNVHNDHFNVNEDNEGSGLIAHFHAHANEPVANMAFDQTGTLLVTTCKLGHNFHVFRLMAHPCSSAVGAVHHLYTLHRGDTTAKVIDISFNHDSRWVTVSTHRGTTHIFPITPYGGPINVRTHCQPYIVNRASRFHKSAGLEDIERSPMGRRSPVLSTSPSSSGQYDRYPTLIQQNTLNNNFGNPRLPPYPHPITIYPLYQIKQPLNVVLNPNNKNQSPSHSPTGTDNVYSVCAVFCSPRLCVIGSPKLDMERREGGRRPVDSLFIMTQSGSLVEYVLEPKARTVLDKITEDCNLDLGITGRMQWNLQRLKASQELRPPLSNNSPLLLATEAVVSQIPTASDLCDHIGLTRQDSKDSLSSDHSNKDDDEQWLSQVEIITHAGPHRRLWMGPQFSFKTYQENTTVLSSNSSSLLSQSPETNMGAMDIMGEEGDLESLKVQPARSNPVTMPTTRPAYRRLSGSDSSPSPGLGQITPLMIEAGSFEQSPHLLDVYSNWTESTVEKQPRGNDDVEEDRLKQTLADAMVESPMKDIDKLSLRQDLTRSGVTNSKKKIKTDKVQCVPEKEIRKPVAEKKQERKVDTAATTEKKGATAASKSSSKEKVKAVKEKAPEKSDTSQGTPKSDLKKSETRGKTVETNKSREQTPSAQGSEVKCKNSKQVSNDVVLPKSKESVNDKKDSGKKAVVNKSASSIDSNKSDVKSSKTEKKQTVSEGNQKDSKGGKKKTSKGKSDDSQTKGDDDGNNKASSDNGKTDSRNGRKKPSVTFEETFEDKDAITKTLNTSLENLSEKSSPTHAKSARKSLEESYENPCVENLDNTQESLVKSNTDIVSEISKNKNGSSNNFLEVSKYSDIDEVEPLETVEDFYDAESVSEFDTEQIESETGTTLEIEKTDKRLLENEGRDSDINVIESIELERNAYPNDVNTITTHVNFSEEAKKTKVNDPENVSLASASKIPTEMKMLQNKETECTRVSKDKKKKKGKNGRKSESKISEQREISVEKEVTSNEKHQEQHVSHVSETHKQKDVKKELHEESVEQSNETRKNDDLDERNGKATLVQSDKSSESVSCKDTFIEIDTSLKHLTKEDKINKTTDEISIGHVEKKTPEAVTNVCLDTTVIEKTRGKNKKKKMEEAIVTEVSVNKVSVEAVGSVWKKDNSSLFSNRNDTKIETNIKKDTVTNPVKVNDDEGNKVCTKELKVGSSNKEITKDTKKNRNTGKETNINSEKTPEIKNVDDKDIVKDDMSMKEKQSDKKGSADRKDTHIKQSVIEPKPEVNKTIEHCEDFPALNSAGKSNSQEDMLVVKSKKSRRKAAAAAAKLEESQYFDTTDCLKDPECNTDKSEVSVIRSESTIAKEIKQEKKNESITDEDKNQLELNVEITAEKDDVAYKENTAQSSVSNEETADNSKDATEAIAVVKQVEKTETAAEEDDMFVVKSKRKKKKKKNAMEDSIFESAVEEIKPQDTDTSVYMEAPSALPNVDTEESSELGKVKNSETKKEIEKTQVIDDVVVEEKPEISKDKVKKKESKSSIASSTFSYASCVGNTDSKSNEVQSTVDKVARPVKDRENNIVLSPAWNVLGGKKVSSGTLETSLPTKTLESEVETEAEEASWETAAMDDDMDDGIQVIEDTEVVTNDKEKESKQDTASGISIASKVSDHRLEQVVSSSSERSSEEREVETKLDKDSERSSEERDLASKPVAQKSETKTSSNKKKKKKNRK